MWVKEKHDKSQKTANTSGKNKETERGRQRKIKEKETERAITSDEISAQAF